jgi:hypothetical protein
VLVDSGIPLIWLHIPMTPAAIKRCSATGVKPSCLLLLSWLFPPAAVILGAEEASADSGIGIEVVVFVVALVVFAVVLAVLELLVLMSMLLSTPSVFNPFRGSLDVSAKVVSTDTELGAAVGSRVVVATVRKKLEMRVCAN